MILKTNKLLPSACIILLSLSAFAQAGFAVETSVEFGGAGLQKISINGENILANGAIRVTEVEFADSYRDQGQIEEPWSNDVRFSDNRTFRKGNTTPEKQTFDAGNATRKLTFAWGEVTAAYVPSADRLDIALEVTNKTDEVIETITIHVADLNLPGRLEMRYPFNHEWHDTRNRLNVEHPMLMQLTHEMARIVVASPQSNKPYTFEPSREGDIFGVAVSFGQKPGAAAEPYDNAWTYRSIKPGESERLELTIRFGEPDADPYELARDVLAKFGEDVPMMLDWPDRRPFGQLWMSGGGKINIRRWWDFHGDPRTREGREKFNEWAKGRTRRAIEHSLAGGFQGVIVWGLEGAEFSPRMHTWQSVGDPRVVKYMAPEMDAIVDELFAMIHEAGLSVGICIRPTMVTPLDRNGNLTTWKDHHTVDFGNFRRYLAPEHADEKEMFCAAERLAARIEYARDRWGATLFYIEAPFMWRPATKGEAARGLNKMLSANAFAELQRRFPDVLLIPQFQNLEYWAYGAQHTIRHGAVTGPEIRMAYPEAMTVSFISHTVRDVEEDKELYIDAVRKGDSLLLHAWWDGGGLNISNEIYSTAASDAPVQILLSEDGITLSGEAVSLEDLSRRVEAAVKGKPLPERRVAVRYDAETSAERLKAILDAAKEAGGVIVLTLPVEEEEE